MIKLPNAILCEGTYDKIKLSNLFDAPIVTAGGFSIRNHPEILELLKIHAATAPVIILTDPDAAGFAIRSFVASALPKDSVIHVYVPDIWGKEKRKEQVSKEGKLGVEGVSDDLILKAFQKAGILDDALQPTEQKKEIHLFLNPARLYEDGLLGAPSAAEKRRKLSALLNLPARLNQKAFCAAVCRILDEDTYQTILDQLSDK